MHFPHLSSSLLRELLICTFYKTINSHHMYTTATVHTRTHTHTHTHTHTCTHTTTTSTTQCKLEKFEWEKKDEKKSEHCDKWLKKMRTSIGYIKHNVTSSNAPDHMSKATIYVPQWHSPASPDRRHCCSGPLSHGTGAGPVDPRQTSTDTQTHHGTDTCVHHFTTAYSSSFYTISHDNLVLLLFTRIKWHLNFCGCMSCQYCIVCTTINWQNSRYGIHIYVGTWQWHWTLRSTSSDDSKWYTTVHCHTLFGVVCFLLHPIVRPCR